MIDWDEINWRSAVGIILFALLAIAASIFVINDYTTAKSLKAELESETAQVKDFYSTWKPPSQKSLDETKAKLDSLRAELNQLKPKLGLELNLDEIQNKIRQVASSTGISLDKMEPGAITSDGFLKVGPVSLSIKGANEQLSRFLIGVDNMGVSSRRRGTPTITSGQVDINLEFLAFDLAGWNNSYSCTLRVNPPELKETNISRVKIFKGNLADLKNEVDAEKSKLSNAQQLLAEQCELEKESKGLENQIKLSKDLKQ